MDVSWLASPLPLPLARFGAFQQMVGQLDRVALTPSTGCCGERVMDGFSEEGLGGGVGPDAQRERQRRVKEMPRTTYQPA